MKYLIKKLLESSLTVLAASFYFFSCNPAERLTPEHAKEISKHAYIYGFPMVVNYKTMYSYAVNKNSPEYKGGFNHLACLARVFTPDDKAIVTPNSDTPYCFLWGDMRSEPLVLTIPAIEEKRFYSVQLIDLFTHNFAYVSSIEQGNVPANYLITGPGWKGDVPEEIAQVIPCETHFFLAGFRTQLFNPGDLDNVKAIQEEYEFQPLSSFLGTAPPAPAPPLDFPTWNEGDQFTAKSFRYVDFMLSLASIPQEEDSLMREFAKIDLGTEKAFDLSVFSPEIQKAIEDGAKEGFAAIEAFIQKHNNDPLFSGRVFGTREFLNQSAKQHLGEKDIFILRAAAAHMGLYGNSVKEAIYPFYVKDKEGSPLDGSIGKYQVTFAKGELPPVSAFWSLTMYDGKTQLLVHNPINRYLLNSPMMDDLVFGADGSLTFYVQKDSPGKNLEPNWLPAPDRPFYCVLRLYGPQESAMSGEWMNPPMTKIN